MSNKDIQSKVNEIRELKRMADELENAIESLQDEIKAHMTDIGADELLGVDYKVTWKSVTSSHIDGKALTTDFPEMAQKYTKTTTGRRFCIA